MGFKEFQESFRGFQGQSGGLQEVSKGCQRHFRVFKVRSKRFQGFSGITGGIRDVPRGLKRYQGRYMDFQGTLRTSGEFLAVL